MRAVVQRVLRAEVRVEGEVVGLVGRGLCALVGAGVGDGDRDVATLVDKIVHLRVFPQEDEAGPMDKKMNRSLLETGGGLLIVSQFTLYGDARKGRRPSFTEALEPALAERLVEALVAGCRVAGVADVQTGRFRASMELELVNWGPVTILLDSRKGF